MRSLSLIIIAVLLVSCRPPNEVSVVSFETHNLTVDLNVPDRNASISDEGTMHVKPGWNLFRVNPTSVDLLLMINEKRVPIKTFLPSDSVRIPVLLKQKINALQLPDQLTVAFQTKLDGSVPFDLSYSASFLDNVENARFSRENVGREVAGTIQEKGAYLSPSAGYYPQGDDDLMSFTLKAKIPPDWESIVDGNRLSSAISNQRKIQIWKNPYKSDGLMFMASPYVVKSTVVDDVEVYCYFFAEDTSLFDTYLTATAEYIDMYSSLIGPYPFQRFTVAENFFPTGYGMPAWTLLGQQVLRLPFIVRTSLGHEVLHNWWGNSVYVDYPRGNWCESATTYGADYRYQLLKSSQAARDYRKDILKQYASYVTAENDFPIRKFTSRTSPDTRTIGYNKAMMVYHMIAREIGDQAFFDAWKLIYNRYRGQKISWEEWLHAFEETSGKSLSYIIPQWIDQPGAANLSLEIINVKDNPERATRRVDLQLKEENGRYSHLPVPLRISGETVRDTVVLLTGSREKFSIDVPAATRTIAVDPGFNLFRQLYPEEIEPIIAAILGATEKCFISYVSTDSVKSFFQTFGNNLSEAAIVVEDPSLIESLARDVTPVLLNPEPMPDYLNQFIQVTADSMRINGRMYPRKGHSAILTGRDWSGFSRFLVILTDEAESLPRLGELIPHYGKYSFLVFAGSHNIGKGQWPAMTSPLVKELPKRVIVE